MMSATCLSLTKEQIHESSTTIRKKRNQHDTSKVVPFIALLGALTRGSRYIQDAPKVDRGEPMLAIVPVKILKISANFKTFFLTRNQYNNRTNFNKLYR